MSISRLALSDYLNTLPISYAFQQGHIQPGFEIVYAPPFKCAEMLKSGDVDAALIPAIEYARADDQYEIFDSFCIGSAGPVQSVSLFLKSDIPSIQRVALDAQSRTSVVLTKLLLEEKFDCEPDYVEQSADLNIMLSDTDAALIIGDDALNYLNSGFHRLDLAEEWREFSGKPFVFAFIAAPHDTISEHNKQQLEAAFMFGIEHIDDITQAWAVHHSEHRAEFYKDYLLKSIRYDFDEDAKAGLNMYFDYAFLRAEIPYFPEFRYALQPDVREGDSDEPDTILPGG